VLEVVPPVVDDLEQQQLAAAELVLERAPRDAGAPRDLVRARAVIALVQDALDGGVEDPRARRRAVGPLPARPVAVGLQCAYRPRMETKLTISPG
jgi:hypothetical protein